MELKDFIISLEKRPFMYISSNDIFMLSAFIIGYLIGRDNLSPMEEKFSKDFHTWVQNYYECPNNLSWWNIIYHYEGNHNKAFERFFDLYKRWYESNEAK